MSQHALGMPRCAGCGRTTNQAVRAANSDAFPKLMPSGLMATSDDVECLRHMQNILFIHISNLTMDRRLRGLTNRQAQIPVSTNK